MTETKTEDYSVATKDFGSECSKGWFGIPNYSGEEEGGDACKKCGATENQGCKAKRQNA